MRLRALPAVALASLAVLPAVAAADERPEFLVVGIGDSFASGEGSPETAGDHDDEGNVGQHAETWGPDADAGRCHRSPRSGPSLAAQALQERFPAIHVTFRSFACSGAKIRARAEHPELGGLLDPYPGVEPDGSAPMAPQIAQINTFLAGRANRRIDALVMAVGINDMGFGEIVADCVNPLIADCSANAETVQRLAAGLGSLPSGYRLLNRALRGEDPGGGRPALAHPRPSRVVISHYPDPTRDDDGDLCHQRPAGDLFDQLRESETSWAYASALLPLNRAVQQAAAQHGWYEVTGLAEASRRHGLCAEDRWFNTNTDALRSQGADAPLLWYQDLAINASSGALHPNPTGHERWAKLITPQLEREVRARFSLRDAAPRLRVADARATRTARGRRPVLGFIRLAWNDPVDFESGFELEIRRDKQRTVVEIGPNTTSYTHRFSGRAVYRVRACGPVECSPWSPQVLASNVRPTRPPSDLSARQSATSRQRRITLSFVPGDAYHTHFQVRYRHSSEARTRVATTPASPFVLGSPAAPLAGGGSYWFRIRACSDVGCSAYGARFEVPVQAVALLPRPDIGDEVRPLPDDPRRPGPGPRPRRPLG